MQYGKSSAEILAEMLAKEAASDNAKIASVNQYEDAQLSSYESFTVNGITNSVQIRMDDSDSVNEIVGRKRMKEIGRNIKISKRVQALYNKFLKRSITQAYKSEFHKDPQTRVGYMKNSPLVYRGTGRIGYGTGKLYESISVKLRPMQTTTFDEYGSKTHTFRFGSPSYEKYGEILSTGKRSNGPIPIAELIEWINRKRVSGYLKNKDVRTREKVLSFAMAIMNSYRKGRTRSGSKRRQQSMAGWEKWEGNQRVQDLFRKIHDAGAKRYYKMMLEDVLQTFKKLK